MRKAGLQWALIAAFGLVPAGAHAATYDLDFSTTDSVFTVDATITTADTLNAVGGYDILSMLGTIFGPGGGTIALEPNTSQPFIDNIGAFQYDNVYFPTGLTSVDSYGILFSASGYDYNLYSTGPGAYYLSSFNPAGAYYPAEPVVFGDPERVDSGGSVPEPSTWALTLLGFAGLALAAGRKARRRGAALGAPVIGPAQKA